MVLRKQTTQKQIRRYFFIHAMSGLDNEDKCTSQHWPNLKQGGKDHDPKLD